MKTQDEINKASEKYAPHDNDHGASYQTNMLMKRQGFVMGATFANGYSVEEMKAAFDAAVEMINHEWHMEEFHGESCKCVPLEYDSFERWLKLWEESR